MPAGCRLRPNIKVPQDAIGCGFHEAVRGVLSHHVVIRDGKIANYHPYPPTCWNASPRDAQGVPGPYEDAVQNTPIFEENDQDNFKGIDIMRTVRSFDPCLPCGVHMYLGPGANCRSSTRRCSALQSTLAARMNGRIMANWLTRSASAERRRPAAIKRGDRTASSREPSRQRRHPGS